jgi:YD repeat-containing protein
MKKNKEKGNSCLKNNAVSSCLGQQLKKTILAILSFVVSLPLFSQLPNEPITALSPNAASLGTYGHIPVSYYTGTPNIVIPLHDLKFGNYTMPISLNYHPSGIRPDQHPGWVGMGWSLHAGGVITRSVRGMTDEYHNPHSQAGNLLSRVGYYYAHTLVDTNTWNSKTGVCAHGDLGIMDLQPDEFSFTFADYSGKFYLTHSGTWAVQCNKPVKVIFNDIFFEHPFSKEKTRYGTEGYSHSFGGFTIVTEDGTQYVFGGNIQSIEYSISFFDQNSYDWKATAWYLTNIILPNQQEITFSYERGNFINQMYIALYNEAFIATDKNDKEYFCTHFPNRQLEESYSGRLISPVYLSDIHAGNERVVFIRNLTNELKYDNKIYEYNYEHGDSYSFLPYLNPNNIAYPAYLSNLKWWMLIAIEVKHQLHYNQETDIKRINFEYNNKNTERLRLLKVWEDGKSPYKFDYFYPEKMPPYLANKTDHWGYYNDREGTIYPTETYYSRKEPANDPNQMQFGVLNKITYPTGGYTTLDFDPHEYRKQVKFKRWEGLDSTFSENKRGGGLRIKRITNYLADNFKSSEKEYFYVSDYLKNKTNAQTSSGVLGGQIQYESPECTFYLDGECISSYVLIPFVCEPCMVDIYIFLYKCTKSIFSSVSILPSCNNTNGSNIGYTEVIEKREDGAFTRYGYTNFDNGYLDEAPEIIVLETTTPYKTYASKEQDRGLLILQEDYNANGQKVKSKSICYEKDNYADNYVPAIDIKKYSACIGSGCCVNYYEGSAYKTYTYLQRPILETDTIYDITGKNPIVTTTDYEYNQQKLVKTITTSSSESVQLKKELKYPSDFASTYPYNNMVANNVLSPIVEQIEYKDAFLVKKERYNYTQWYSSFYAPVNLQIQNGANTLETRKTYLFDNKSNIQEIIKDNVDKTVYLWGYNHQYPIAEIKNATYQQVKDVLSETVINQIASAAMPDASDLTQLNNLRLHSNLQKAEITTYEYKPLVGITSITDPRGVVTTYEYDAFGRLQTVKDPNGNKLEGYDYHYKNP